MADNSRMRKRSSKRPRDIHALAKVLVDMATGEASLDTTIDGKNPAAVALGRKGGLKGGISRAASLSPSERTRIARVAAQSRWKKK
jgi:hypothetical protein